MISEITAVNPKLKSYAVINQGDAKGSDNIDALDIIAECPDLACVPTSIGQRKSFANAAADGLGVIELKNSDKKATQEIRALYEMVYANHI
jgi:chromosome partitioning protein